MRRSEPIKRDILSENYVTFASCLRTKSDRPIVGAFEGKKEEILSVEKILEIW